MGKGPPPAALIDRLNGLGVAAGRKALGAAIVDRDKAALKMAVVSDLILPGPAGGLAARLYRPDDRGDARPLMVFFHGGGFTFCDAATHDALCRRLSHGAGIDILSADYRLAPEHAWPAQFDDALAAARWVLADRKTMGLRSGPVILGGDSAGGYLALAVARLLNSERPGTVGLTCLIYPLLHLDDAVWATENAGLRRLGRVAVGFIRTRLVAPPPNLLDADPAKDPPCILTYGGLADPCRADCLAYERALTAAGVPVLATGFAPLPHGYANMTHLLPAARTAVDRTAVLLAEGVADACARAQSR